MVLLHLAEPVAGLHLVAFLHERFEVPKAFAIERFCIFTALQEDTFHLVEVVLKSVVVVTEHTRAELYLEHVSCELSLSTDPQTACAFEDLHIYVLTENLDDLCHQSVTACCDVAYLALKHRTVHSEGDHIGDNATYNSFCHLFMLYYLSKQLN